MHGGLFGWGGRLTGGSHPQRPADKQPPGAGEVIHTHGSRNQSASSLTHSLLSFVQVCCSAASMPEPVIVELDVSRPDVSSLLTGCGFLEPAVVIV